MNEDELEIHEELMAYNPLASMVPYGRMELSEAEFHCPEILQFGEDNLCLAIMLTQHEHFRPEESGKQWGVVRGLLGNKRTELLRWLGWPGEKWCVHLISKIDMARIEVGDLLKLRAACHMGTILPRLRHLSVINAEVIRVTTNPKLSPLVTDSFLRQLGVVDDGWMFSVSQLLRYALNMANSLGEECPVFSTVEQAFIYVLEDNQQAFAPILLALYGTDQLPQPPFPLASGREPSAFELESVRSANDLYLWAESQKNCAFSKIDQILAGQMFLFKVRRPIRGTLSLLTGSDGNWRIDEFRAAENKEVPQSMIFEMAAHLDLCVERGEVNEESEH